MPPSFYKDFDWGYSPNFGKAPKMQIDSGGLSAIRDALAGMGLKHATLEVYENKTKMQLEVVVQARFGKLLVTKVVSISYEEIDNIGYASEAISHVVEKVIWQFADWVNEHANEG